MKKNTKVSILIAVLAFVISSLFYIILIPEDVEPFLFLQLAVTCLFVFGLYYFFGRMKQDDAK